MASGRLGLVRGGDGEFFDVLLLFALAFCKAAKAADPDGADDWWGE